MMKQVNYQTFIQTHGLPDCENRTVSKNEEDRVFCSRANDWVNLGCCLKCSAEARQYASQEW